MLKLSNHVQLDLNTGHHAAVRIVDGGRGVVGSTAEEPGNDVRNLGDGEGEGLPPSVCPGVEGGGALLRKVGRAEIVWDEAQQVINIVGTEKNNFKNVKKFPNVVLPRANMLSLDLETRKWNFHTEEFLGDGEIHRGASLDGLR